MSPVISGDPAAIRTAAGSIRSRANDIDHAAKSIAGSYNGAKFNVPGKGKLDELVKSLAATSRQLMDQAENLNKQLMQIAEQLERVGGH
jgi:methyl-accepting chemotaxis protein